MRTTERLLAAAVLAGASLLALGAPAHASGSPEHITTTLDAWPTLPVWQQVENAKPAGTVNVSILDICAPDGSGSGCNGQPADAPQPAWYNTISALKGAGITLLYYISTNYGATALSTVESELANGKSWYGIPSPMFDEMAPNGTCSNGGSPLACSAYYGDLYTYAVSAGATYVMYNPGTTYGTSTADMFGSAEILQLFEGSSAQFESASFPSWLAQYQASQFSATISAGTSSTVQTDLTDACHDHIGRFYEDDEAEPPNYATLPAFWTTEVSDAASTCT